METSKTTLHEEAYDEIRDRTRLHSQHVQAARNKAADTLKGIVARWQQGEYARKPHFSTLTVVYDKRCATFHDDNVSFATVDGRIDAQCVLLDGERDTTYDEYPRSDDYEVTGAELHHKDDEWLLQAPTPARRSLLDPVRL